MRRLKTCGCIVELYYGPGCRSTKVKYIKRCNKHSEENKLKIDKEKIGKNERSNRKKNKS